MRLREIFDGSAETGADESLDRDVERELEALDRALAGLPVEPEHQGVARLAEELRAQRPQPGAELDARLDRLAAEGFPPRASDRVGRAGRRLADGVAGLRDGGLRRLAPALGAAATFVVVVGVAINQTGVLDGSDEGPPGDLAVVQEDGGDAATSVEPSGGSAAGAEKQPALAAGEEANGITRQYLDDASRSNAVILGSDARAGSAAEVPYGKRKIAQEIDLALSTSPADFRDAADEVMDVVRDQRGFVRSSNVSSGRGGPVPLPAPAPGPAPGAGAIEPAPEGGGAPPFGQASFDLRIPASRLQATIAALSDLGHVVSRTDGSIDITSRFVSAKKRIDALTQTRGNLLDQLAAATTVPEQESIERRLRIVEEQLADAEEDLGDAQRRVQLVPVRVTITADPRVADRGEKDDGAWGIGDAFHDAGRILVVAASVAVVVAAALVPFALLALLVWAAWRGWTARARERALDSAPAA